MARLTWTIVSSLALLGCQEGAKYEPPSHNLESLVTQEPIGSDVDQWIEMKNIAGEWERTGLIFGYNGDYEECLKAIDGMKRVNKAREYRCVPANRDE